MNLAFLASFIAFIFFLTFTIKNQNKKAIEREKQFWSREAKANSVRRKPLNDLPYITISLETFPTHILQEDPEILECISIIESLTSQKIVNLTGYTNTDLKLTYGTATITELSEFDQNYTVLVRTLQKWADILLETGYVEEAVPLMEFALRTGTDVGKTYYELADYYLSKQDTNKLDYLMEMAKNLRSSSKKHILRKLQEMQR